MEVVINIPKSWEKCNNTFLRNCIRNGRVLPKGHGRLKDADAFIKAECSQCDGNCGVCDCDCLNCKSEWRCEFIKDIDSADIIVEADKEDEDGKR